MDLDTSDSSKKKIESERVTFQGNMEKSVVWREGSWICDYMYLIVSFSLYTIVIYCVLYLM